MEEKKANTDHESFFDRIFHHMFKIKNHSGFKNAKENEDSESSQNVNSNTNRGGKYNNKITQAQKKESSSKKQLSNLWTLSSNLREFNEFLIESPDFLNLTYQYPQKLRNQLVKDTTELISLQREVQASAEEVTRLRRDKKAINKEIKTNTKFLEKLRRAETEELENIFKKGEQSEFERWEDIKYSFKADDAEKCLEDIKRKRLSLDALEVLILREMKNHGVSKEDYNQLNEFSDLDIAMDTKKKRQKKKIKKRHHICGGQKNKQKEKNSLIPLNNECEGMSDDGSEDTSSENSTPNASRVETSANRNSDLVQLNMTPIATSTIDAQNSRIRLPAMNHPLVSERTEPGRTETEQQSQTDGLHIVLEHIYLPDEM